MYDDEFALIVTLSKMHNLELPALRGKTVFLRILIDTVHRHWFCVKVLFVQRIYFSSMCTDDEFVLIVTLSKMKNVELPTLRGMTFFYWQTFLESWSIINVHTYIEYNVHTKVHWLCVKYRNQKSIKVCSDQVYFLKVSYYATFYRAIL